MTRNEEGKTVTTTGTSALVSLGVPKEEAQVYESGVKEGNTLILVPVGDESADDVTEILTDHGATQVRSFKMTI